MCLDLHVVYIRSELAAEVKWHCGLRQAHGCMCVCVSVSVPGLECNLAYVWRVQHKVLHTCKFSCCRWILDAPAPVEAVPFAGHGPHMEFAVASTMFSHGSLDTMKALSDRSDLVCVGQLSVCV